MKTILFLTLLLCSCATAEMLPEDELFITRKYAGQYISHSDPGKVRFGNPPIMAIKTTIPDFDTIKIYAKKLDIVPGERMYIRKSWHSQAQYWFFTLEAGKHSFRICEFGYLDKLLTQSWY